LPRSLLYRSPPFSRRSRALLSAFKRGLRRMLASDLVRALPNRCLHDIFFVRRSNTDITASTLIRALSRNARIWWRRQSFPITR
jgi:hypothetical protein